MNDLEIIREMMAQYDRKRALWIRENGSSVGFDEWFTAQVKGAK